MKYLVLELFGGLEYAAIVTDEEGNVKVFDNLKDAMSEANDCQKGFVVSIPNKE